MQPLIVSQRSSHLLEDCLHEAAVLGSSACVLRPLPPSAAEMQPRPHRNAADSAPPAGARIWGTVGGEAWEITVTKSLQQLSLWAS